MKKIIHILLKCLNKKIIDLNSDLNELKKLISTLHAFKTEHELIRIGSAHDGGYLLPDDIENIEAVFSPGVSNIHSFELDMLEKYNIKSFMCDFTVDKIVPQYKELIFKKKHLGVVNNSKYHRLEDWVNSNSNTNNLILQMDIEGSEYPVILDTSLDTLDKFRIMIIEFHDLDLLFNFQFFEIYKSVMNKILKNFLVVHLHPNNCCGKYISKGIEIPKVLEITFLNKNRLSRKKYQKVRSKRHKLDVDNTQLPSLDLPENWYLN